VTAITKLTRDLWQLTHRTKESVMAGLYDGLEEAAFFKRADGGYIYSSPNPWLFGPTVNYVVTEAEKAAIANRIRDTLRAIKPVALAAMIVMPIFLIGVIALVVWSGASSYIIYASEFVVIGLYIGLTHRYSMRRLRPLIANLPRTSERITLRAKTAKFSAVVPRKFLLLLLSCSAIGCAGALFVGVEALIEGHFLRLLPTMLPAVLLSGAGMAYFGKIWLGRRKAKAGEGAISR
jgi:hypothetical protein